MTGDTPAWAENLIKSITNMEKDIHFLKDQTSINCSKLDGLAGSISGLKAVLDSTCDRLVRIEEQTSH